MQILDEKLEENWKNYLWQSAIAGISIFLILVVLVNVTNLVLIASAGATTFTVFALPRHGTARPRNVIGGHAIGVGTGLAFLYLSPIYFSGGLAVGVGTLLMVIMNSEHPPAAGTALGIADFSAYESAMYGSMFILVTAAILSAIRICLFPWMKDLM